MISDSRIDSGKPFDWGRVSSDYAKYRDIYPQEFYDIIVKRGLCVEGQNVLDIGTGTGVLPRNMYKYGAKWTGTDISENQILQAERLAKESGMDIHFLARSTELLDFDEESFDVITACQCFFYFEHEKASPKLAGFLKKGGKLLILYMAWLPFEDKIAGKSEEIILKYNPGWSGAGEFRRPIDIPDVYNKYFDLTYSHVYDINVSFTRESWHGRMRACRGVGASLNENELERWDNEHRAFLNEECPETFDILHYAAMAELSWR